MKRNDFYNIASYKELRVARNENNMAIKRIKCDIPRHSAVLVESLSPKALIENFMRYISPLLDLYGFFRKRGV